jgi:hypothetical protein
MVDKTAAAMIVVMVVILIISLLGFTGVFSGFGGFGGGDVNEKPCNLPGAVCSFGAAIGFPAGWLRTDTFIWYCFIPLAGVWMIIFGFLDKIRIFKGSINAVLSFLIAFSMIPLGIFVLIVALLFSIMGVYSVFLFVGLFFIGTILYSRGLIGGWKYAYGGVKGSYEKSISKEDKVIANAMGEVARLKAEMKDAENLRGKYQNMGQEKATEAIKNTLAPDLLNAEKALAAAQARKQFLQQQMGRVKRTFDLQAKT